MAAQPKEKVTRQSKITAEPVFDFFMLELERFFERGATALESSLLWFLDNVMDLDAVFRFHLDRIVLHICGQIDLFVRELKVFVVDPAQLDVKEAFPILMLANKDLRLIQFLARLAQVGIEIEVTCGSSTGTGETGGDVLTVGGFLLLDNFKLVVISVSKEIIAADVTKD